MTAEPIESMVNIGKELGARLRAIGVTTAAELHSRGDESVFAELGQRYPDDACTHTRLALAGAVRGVRWTALPKDLRAELLRGQS